MLSFFILRNIAWFYPTWPRASEAEYQTKFGDNSGGKLLLKFSESQGAQDVKTAKNYWKESLTGTIVTVSQDFPTFQVFGIDGCQINTNYS